MKTYLITDRAGPYVAGMRVAGIEPGNDGRRRIDLCDASALYELQIGSIAIEAVDSGERIVSKRKRPDVITESEPTQ